MKLTLIIFILFFNCIFSLTYSSEPTDSMALDETTKFLLALYDDEDNKIVSISQTSFLRYSVQDTGKIGFVYWFKVRQIQKTPNQPTVPVDDNYEVGVVYSKENKNWVPVYHFSNELGPYYKPD